MVQSFILSCIRCLINKYSLLIQVHIVHIATKKITLLRLPLAIVICDEKLDKYLNCSIETNSLIFSLIMEDDTGCYEDILPCAGRKDGLYPQVIN